MIMPGRCWLTRPCARRTSERIRRTMWMRRREHFRRRIPVFGHLMVRGENGILKYHDRLVEVPGGISFNSYIHVYQHEAENLWDSRLKPIASISQSESNVWTN